ncbi:MAG: hypothetical protein RLZZ127_1990 [Planctomycetota bacterium]|jgi:hypothetical protein
METFPEFKDRMVRQIAIGLGVPGNALTGPCPGIYVDPLMATIRSRKWPYDQGYHLFHINYDLEALHAFAERLGLRRQWLHAAPGFPHYDLTPPGARAGPGPGRVGNGLAEPHGPGVHDQEAGAADPLTLSGTGYGSAITTRDAPMTKPMTYESCQTAAVQALRGVAHMLAERHGDDLGFIDELLDAAKDIEARNPGWQDRLTDLSGCEVRPGQAAELRETVRAVAATALVLLNGCDW